MLLLAMACDKDDDPGEIYLYQWLLDCQDTG